MNNDKFYIVWHLEDHNAVHFYPDGSLDTNAKRITWDEYVQRFVKEMDNSLARDMMVSVGNLAKTKDVYLVCFERKGNCHRFLLVNMINRLTAPASADYERINKFVSEHPKCVDMASADIAAALRG